MKKGVKNSIIGFGAAFLIISLALATYGFTLMPEEVFAKRIKLNSKNFSADTFSEIKDSLTPIGDAFLTNTIEWTSVQGNTSLTMAEMGVRPAGEDLEAYLETFMEKATGFEKLSTFVFGKNLDYALIINEQMLINAFVEAKIEQGNRSAAFSYDYENGEVLILEERLGYGIEYDEVKEILEDKWENFFEGEKEVATQELPLRTSEPEIRQAVLEALLAKAQELSATELSFQGDTDKTLEFKVKDHMNFLIPAEDEYDKLGFDLSEEEVNKYIDEVLAPEFEKETKSVRITGDEEVGFEFEGSARFGKVIDREHFTAELKRRLKKPSEEAFYLAVNIIQPEINVSNELEEMGVTELLEFGFSNFGGSPWNRVHNIGVGMDKFNGTLIAPGEEFSFTSLMGPIDAAHGWLPELVIKGDETKPEYGGGLCQVSSTMFRAAIYTGMPITARKNHSYAVNYYFRPNGPGLDATIYDPAPDFRFKNDTESHILIQGYTEDSFAYFVFYGTNDGRTVDMEGPFSYGYNSIEDPVTVYTDELDPGVRKVDENSHVGFQTDWYRTINYSDGTSSERENFHSNYQARPLKYLEGTPLSEEETST